MSGSHERNLVLNKSNIQPVRKYDYLYGMTFICMPNTGNTFHITSFTCRALQS